MPRLPWPTKVERETALWGRTRITRRTVGPAVAESTSPLRTLLRCCRMRCEAVIGEYRVAYIWVLVSRGPC